MDLHTKPIKPIGVNSLNRPPMLLREPLKLYEGFLKASSTPVQDIESIAYTGQPNHMKMYKTGYEEYMNSLPILNIEDNFFQDKVEMSTNVMKQLASNLREASWINDNYPENHGFDRTLLAIESPSPYITQDYLEPDNRKAMLKDNAELILARWGDGFKSPIHGHAPGFTHEEVIKGTIRSTIYRMIDPTSLTVRPIRTDLIKDGVINSRYNNERPSVFFRNSHNIHSFTAIGDTATVHYLVEHSKDGMGTPYKIEYFDDVYKLKKEEVQQIDAYQGMYLQKGDVVLVRSTNVPEYGDHYIVVTGKPVIKEHGLRPEELAIEAPNNTLLDQYEMKTGLILLKLKSVARAKFLQFHSIKIEGNEIIFPKS